MIVDELILEYERKLVSINSEINELCSVNTHPDDLELCKKLNIKAKCYEDFIKDLKNIL
jgi:hypothetical protein